MLLAVYFLKNKSDVFNKFKEFEATVSGQRIGTLRTDNGGEYMSSEFEAYLKSKGHQLYSPEQNGTAERMNQPDQCLTLALRMNIGLKLLLQQPM